MYLVGWIQNRQYVLVFDIFKELITHTSGDFDEAIDWLRQLDVEYKLTDKNYTIDDFIEDLKKNGYLKDDDNTGGFKITAKSEQTIRQSALEEIFGKLKKTSRGQHQSNFSGQGDERNAERRQFEFGDALDRIDMTQSIHNAQVNHGIGDFHLTEKELFF